MGAAHGHEFLSDAARGLAALADVARSALTKAVSDRNGTTAIEYAVIASMISIMIVAGATQIGTQLKTYFEQMIVPFL
jgi:Flp pilus assembly pilin Flp